MSESTELQRAILDAITRARSVGKGFPGIDAQVKRLQASLRVLKASEARLQSAEARANRGPLPGNPPGDTLPQ